ncbi:MAG: hypothetical protein AAF218_04480 [Pseudomonadota bacterium]
MTQEELTLANEKMRAETIFLQAQTARIQQQMRWQIPLYFASFAGALVAIINIYGS